jgi:hypothetical protein
LILESLSWFLHALGGRPCFQIFGKGRRECDWRIIDIFANHRRDLDSAWPLWRGTCITFTPDVIVVGWDFAHDLVAEQAERPASRQWPVAVAGGRVHDWRRRLAAGGSSQPSHSEVLAHECGHTWQAIHLGPAYLPIVGSTTLFREGPHPWNRFENEASEEGLFGGLVRGSVIPELMRRPISYPSR